MDSMGKTKICLKYPWMEPSNMGWRDYNQKLSIRKGLLEDITDT